jgi:hypothetical protein
MDPDTSNLIGTLNIAANIVVLVILPLVIFLVKHMAAIRKEAHERIDGLRNDHQQFREHVARHYLSEHSAVRLIDGNREIMHTKIDDVAKSVDRLERGLNKVFDREITRQQGAGQ